MRRTNGTGVAASGTRVAVAVTGWVATGVNLTMGAAVGAGVANTAPVAPGRVGAGVVGARPAAGTTVLATSEAVVGLGLAAGA